MPPKKIQTLSKAEIKQLAKNQLVEAIGLAYYNVVDGKVDKFERLTDEEREYFWQQFDKYAETMCKSIGEGYVASF